MLPISSLCTGSGIKSYFAEIDTDTWRSRGHVVAELGALLQIRRRERVRVELAAKSDLTGAAVVPAGGTVSSTTIAPISRAIIDPASEIGPLGVKRN